MQSSSTFGTSARGSARTLRLALAVTTLALMCHDRAVNAASPTPSVTRTQMIATAKQMADHQWTCKPENRKAPCSTTYRSRWKDNQAVVGVAYDWGGMDDVATFSARLAKAEAAGSHQEEGVTSCTAGVDCSGLVSLCWGQKKKFGTETITEIASVPPTPFNVFKDMKSGDALNFAGTHIVIFAAYLPDGRISVYEASGPESRVVLTESSWARFTKYVPLRYNSVVD
jgi:hypothetical protein